MCPVYDRIGATYARYRRPDPRIAAQIGRALGDAPTIVNLGAGSGSYEPTDRTCIAVEPSAVMIAQRSPNAAPVVQAVAERLPFADGSFAGAAAILTVHHWPDLRAGLDETRRVTRGPIVILTWEESLSRSLWLIDEYLPEAAVHDDSLARLDDVCRLLPGCTVETIPVPHDCTDGFFAAYWRRPEMYLDADARAAISGMALLPVAALERMAAELAADLASGAWQERHADLLDQTTRDYGYRLVISPGDHGSRRR